MFRIGATSYVIPDHILPNARYLAGRVDDVELILFETDEYGSNLPDAATRRELRGLAASHDLTYTVHLPLDVLPGADADSTPLVKAQRVFEATREIEPWAYTLHLDGRLFAPGPDRRAPNAAEVEAWKTGAIQALRLIAGWVGDTRLLCIENVEAWNPAYFAPILDALPLSRTADLGHLWLQGEDGLEALAKWLPRTRVVHLHGIEARDHASLSHAPAWLLDPAVRLLSTQFSGVVTLEVFNDSDLETSLTALRASLGRVQSAEGPVG